jgi:hypothetical protein
LQQLVIVSLEEVQCADTPSPILAGLLQSSGEFAEPGAVVHCTEGVPVTLIGFLRNLGAAVHIGHATTHSALLYVGIFVRRDDFKQLFLGSY